MLIPGSLRGCCTYWSKIEIGMKIKNPGKVIYKVMSQRMRSTNARKPENFENSVRLKGANILLKVCRTSSGTPASRSRPNATKTKHLCREFCGEIATASRCAGNLDANPENQFQTPDANLEDLVASELFGAWKPYVYSQTPDAKVDFSLVI